jgi:hypothetical protein
MRACGAGGSQYKHGSFGLSHAGGRPVVRLERARAHPKVRVPGADTSEPEETVFVLRAKAQARCGFRSA